MGTNIITTVKKLFGFYRDGFRNMRVGKSLWTIIAIKFILFFVIMKLLFFPNLLKENFQTDTERSQFVSEQLTQGK